MLVFSHPFVFDMKEDTSISDQGDYLRFGDILLDQNLQYLHKNFTTQAFLTSVVVALVLVQAKLRSVQMTLTKKQ